MVPKFDLKISFRVKFEDQNKFWGLCKVSKLVVSCSLSGIVISKIRANLEKKSYKYSFLYFVRSGGGRKDSFVFVFLIR